MLNVNEAQNVQKGKQIFAQVSGNKKDGPREVRLKQKEGSIKKARQKLDRYSVTSILVLQDGRLIFVLSCLSLYLSSLPNFSQLTSFHDFQTVISFFK